MTDLAGPPQVHGPPPRAGRPRGRPSTSLPLSREVATLPIGYTPRPVRSPVSGSPATRPRGGAGAHRDTAAFGLPIVDHIVRRSMPQVQVLALPPTRELAWPRSSGWASAATSRSRPGVYGGAPMQRQIEPLRRGRAGGHRSPRAGCSIACRGTLDAQHVRLLFLDEADEMLSMGFEREVTAILDAAAEERRRRCSSPPRSPDRGADGEEAPAEYQVTLSATSRRCEIEHFVYMVAGDKVGALVRIMEVRTRRARSSSRHEGQTDRSPGPGRGVRRRLAERRLAQSDREK